MNRVDKSGVTYPVSSGNEDNKQAEKVRDLTKRQTATGTKNTSSTSITSRAATPSTSVRALNPGDDQDELKYLEEASTYSDEDPDSDNEDNLNEDSSLTASAIQPDTPTATHTESISWIDMAQLINRTLGSTAVTDLKSITNLGSSVSGSMHTGITKAVQNSSLCFSDFQQIITDRTSPDSQERKIIKQAFSFLAQSHSIKAREGIKDYAHLISRSVEVACNNPELSHQDFLAAFIQQGQNEQDQLQKKSGQPD